MGNNDLAQVAKVRIESCCFAFVEVAPEAVPFEGLSPKSETPAGTEDGVNESRQEVAMDQGKDSKSSWDDIYLIYQKFMHDNGTDIEQLLRRFQMYEELRHFSRIHVCLTREKFFACLRTMDAQKRANFLERMNGGYIRDKERWAVEMPLVLDSARQGRNGCQLKQRGNPSF